jgi:hypothetical protein
MFQIAGGAIGLGITTTIFTISSENDLAAKSQAAHAQLTDQQVSVMHGVLAGTDAGTAALSKLPDAAQSKLLGIVNESFVNGIQAGFKFVSIAAVLGLLVSVLFVGGSLRGHRREAAPESAGA